MKRILAIILLAVIVVGTGLFAGIAPPSPHKWKVKGDTAIFVKPGTTDTLKTWFDGVDWFQNGIKIESPEAAVLAALDTVLNLTLSGDLTLLGRIRQHNYRNALDMGNQYVKMDSIWQVFYAHIQISDADTNELNQGDLTWWRNDSGFTNVPPDSSTFWEVDDSVTIQNRRLSYEGVATHADIVYSPVPYGPLIDTNIWRDLIANIDSAWNINDWASVSGMTSRTDTVGGSVDSLEIRPRDPFRIILAYTPLQATKDENPCVSVANTLPTAEPDNNDTEGWSRFIGPVIDTAFDGSDSIWTDTIPNPLFTKGFMDAWADTLNDTPIATPRTVAFQSDVDGFFDKFGRYYVSWRIKWGAEIAVVISGTNDGTFWDRPEYVAGFPGDTGSWSDVQMLSQAIVTDTNGVYRMFAVLVDLGADAGGPDTNYIARFHNAGSPNVTADWVYDGVVTMGQPGSGIPQLVYDRGATHGDTLYPEIWHLEVINHGADELVMIAALGANYSATSAQYLWLLSSRDGGLTWTWAPEPTLGQREVDTLDVKRWLSDPYRSSGFFENNGSEEVLQLALAGTSHPVFVDTTAGADAGLAEITFKRFDRQGVFPDTGETVGPFMIPSEWRIGHAEVYFNRPDSFEVAQIVKTIIPFEDTAIVINTFETTYNPTGGGGTVTLHKTVSPSALLRRRSMFEWISTGNNENEEVDLTAVASEPVHIDSFIFALKSHTSTTSLSAIDSVTFYAPDPANIGAFIGEHAELRVAVGVPSVQASAGSPSRSAVYVNWDWNIAEEIGVTFWISSGGAAGAGRYQRIYNPYLKGWKLSTPVTINQP